MTAVPAAAIVGSIPSPSSGSIDIGPFELRAYGLLIALGVIAGVWLCGRMAERKGIGTTDDVSSIAVWAVAAGIIGARLYHVATEWSRFSDDLGAIPKIWEGGLGIPGGLLAGVLVGLWQGQRRGIEPLPLLTCAAPAIPLAQAIGRWGNWFNQELYGRPTDLPWALEIDDAHNLDHPVGTTFHPTFLYESIWNLGLVGLLLWVDRRFKLGPGRLFAVYLVGYGAGRFWIEGLRIDPTEASDVAGLRWNQWVAVAAIVAGLIWLARTRGSRWPDSADDAGGEATEADGAFPDLLGVVGDPAGDPRDGEERAVVREPADVQERAEPEVDVGQVPDDPARRGDD
jgi:prolipoprotein diacylglyceryl transferase